ncbi:hypothetical protein SprV_1002915000 [Sparganum proliferum]
MPLDGVPPKLIAMNKVYYRLITARVLVRNNLTQPSCIRSGVRQGCILSPILSKYAIGWIIGRALHEGDDVEFAPGHRLTDLDYADDFGLSIFFVVHLSNSALLPSIRRRYPTGGAEEGVNSKPDSTQFVKTWKWFLDLRYSGLRRW